MAATGAAAAPGADAAKGTLQASDLSPQRGPKRTFDQAASHLAMYVGQWQTRSCLGFWPCWCSLRFCTSRRTTAARSHAIRGTLVARGLPDIGRRPWRVDLQDDGREPSPLG